MLGWAVATVAPNCEQKASRGLGRIGVEAYHPRFCERVVSGQPLHPRPLFPGYLFVNPSSVGGWGDVTRVPGLLGVLGMRVGGPLMVAWSLIAELLSMESRWGVLVIAPEMGVGSVVRVERGLLEGGLGMVVRMSGRDRVRVLLSYLGRDTEVDMKKADLALA